MLTSALRDLGAESPSPNPGAGVVDRDDPRVRELVDEIVRLSTEYGVLSEYTAFLALEGEVFSSRERRVSRAAENYDRRALKTRSGAAFGVFVERKRQTQRGFPRPGASSAPQLRFTAPGVFDDIAHISSKFVMLFVANQFKLVLIQENATPLDGHGT